MHDLHLETWQRGLSKDRTEEHPMRRRVIMALLNVDTPWHSTGVIHAIQRRFDAEDLVRRRRSDEQARTASSQRQGRSHDPRQSRGLGIA